MVTSSPELLAVTRRFHTALQAKDTDTLRNLLSDSDNLRYVGTAENEIWSGQVLRDGFAGHVQELPDFEYDEIFAEAFESGQFGWSINIRNMHFSEVDHVVQLRTTIIFGLEEGSWKILHRHVSTPEPNRTVTGVEHKALDDLLRAAQSEDLQVGRAGIASIMFTDVAGSSTIAQTVGDTAWTRIVQQHVAQVQAEIEAQGGRLVKSLGDGTMATFSSARAAMQAAQQIQRRLEAQTDEPRLRVRIGIHTGDVVEAGNDFFGTVVNKGARIAAITAPGEIRVSDASRVMVGGARDFTFCEAASVALRGLDGEHLIYRLEWQA